MEKSINELRKVLQEYKQLGIQEQIDHKKFYLYSIITHSTAIEGSYMDYRKVPIKLEEFCKQMNERREAPIKNPNPMDAYLLSFDAHNILVTIHPWVDGNGRMSRLIMNHIQYEFGLIPTKVVKEDKAEYIQAQNDSREEESMVPFQLFMLKEAPKTNIRIIKYTCNYSPPWYE